MAYSCQTFCWWNWSLGSICYHITQLALVKSIRRGLEVSTLHRFFFFLIHHFTPYNLSSENTGRRWLFWWKVIILVEYQPVSFIKGCLKITVYCLFCFLSSSGASDFRADWGPSLEQLNDVIQLLLMGRDLMLLSNRELTTLVFVEKFSAGYILLTPVFIMDWEVVWGPVKGQ